MKIKLLTLGLLLPAIIPALPQNAHNRQEIRQQMKRGEKNENRKGNSRRNKRFDMAQTLSSGAQIHTIAFSALAFYTGSVYSSSFYPPGKVSDFFGFQYMRDNDLSESGHNTDFLTKAAWHTMHLLDSHQMNILIELAREQEHLFSRYAMARLPLIKAFHRYLDNDMPAGTTILDEEQIKKASRELYLIDAEISYGRAIAFAKVINSLTDEQATTLQSMGKEGMQSWSMPDKPRLNIPRGLNVWVMSNASEMFSWYLRDIEADVYFCPERQGTYFGGFFMKDAPAVGTPGYAIDPQATASKGARMLNNILTAEQSDRIKGIYPAVSASLDSIVSLRKQISTELRKAMSGETPDKDTVMKLCAQYGEYDGEYIYRMAETFTQVGRTLTRQQRTQMKELRDLDNYPDKEDKVFLYSREIDMPEINNTDKFFR